MPREKSEEAYKSFSVRVREGLLDGIRETAKREKRSVNAQIDFILEEWWGRKNRLEARKAKTTA